MRRIDKKTILKIKVMMLLIPYLFIVIYLIHFTIVYDTYHGKAAPNGTIVWSIEEQKDVGNGNVLDTLGGGGKSSQQTNETEAEEQPKNQPPSIEVIAKEALNHMLFQPVTFNGLIISHVVIKVVWLTFIILFGAMMSHFHNKLYHQDRPDEESGSAKWFDDFKTYEEMYVTPYTDADKKNGIPDNNILLAKRLKLSMDTRMTQRNLNVLVVGGSGAGKTFRLIKPNLAQMNCSYVVTDPSGEILQVMGVPLMEDGYNIRLFSTSEMKHSNSYNPLDYIYDENGDVDQTKVGVLVSTFIKNADDLQKKGGGDPFWTKSSTAWMTFAVLFLAEFMPIEERNMFNILKLAQSGKADEGSSSQETMLDKIVAGAKRQNSKAKCFNSYSTFKLAPAKTANSILISMAVDLNPFSMDNVRNLTTTSYLAKRNRKGQITRYIRDSEGRPIRDNNNLDLETIGDCKTALFVNIPQANGAYNFLISMMYSQLFNALYTRAEKIAPNRYHIYDRYEMVISSEYKTEEEANRALALYNGASIVKETDENGVEHVYIFNKDATREETIPAKAAIKQYGYIEEVYSEDVAKNLLKRYKSKAVETAATEDGKKKLKHPIKKLLKKDNKKTNGRKIHDGAYVAKGRLRLPMHVRFLLDEFSNIGEIPDFDKMLSTMRKYEISCTIILQSLTQIKAKYDKIWEVLVGNCDSIVFLGSSENETDKYISEKLGKQTIRTMDLSQSKSATGGNVSNSFKKQARDLMDAAEVGKLNNSDCIVTIRGLDPFLLKKLNFSEHPNFKKTGDAPNADASRFVDDEYLEKHFKCLNKEKADTDAVIENEKQNKEILKEKKGRQIPKGQPIRNKSDLASVSGIPENKLDQASQNMRGVKPDEDERSILFRKAKPFPGKSRRNIQDQDSKPVVKPDMDKPEQAKQREVKPESPKPDPITEQNVSDTSQSQQSPKAKETPAEQNPPKKEESVQKIFNDAASGKAETESKKKESAGPAFKSKAGPEADNTGDDAWFF